MRVRNLFKLIIIALTALLALPLYAIFKMGSDGSVQMSMLFLLVAIIILIIFAVTQYYNSVKPIAQAERFMEEAAKGHIDIREEQALKQMPNDAGDITSVFERAMSRTKRVFSSAGKSNGNGNAGEGQPIAGQEKKQEPASKGKQGVH